MLRNSIRRVLPLNVWNYLKLTKYKLLKLNQRGKQVDLSVYYTGRMAERLESWGEENVWREIKFFLVNLRGRVLDIACGTGVTMKSLSDFHELDIYGFDISDFLVQKAIDRGIDKDHLKVCNAVKTDYPDDFFDYSYSIGSFEHLTEADIAVAITECCRITQRASLYMVPVSRSGKDEGWLKLEQNFYNNSLKWWLAKFKVNYKTVYVIDSAWEDTFSFGKWFICKR